MYNPISMATMQSVCVYLPVESGHLQFSVLHLVVPLMAVPPPQAPPHHQLQHQLHYSLTLLLNKDHQTTINVYKTRTLQPPSPKNKQKVMV